MAELLEELEIKTVGIRAYWGPGATMAVESMERILRQQSYAHLKMVLMSVVNTANNARELTSPILWAVSDLVAAHPQWATRASDWFAAFDKVDLGKLRAFAKQQTGSETKSSTCYDAIWVFRRLRSLR